MKYTFLFTMLFAFVLQHGNAQQIANVDWVVYSNHYSVSDLEEEKIPTLTQAAESIETEGEVVIAEGTKITFRTLPTGFIHLNKRFHVAQGAFFKAHQADFEMNEVEERKLDLSATSDIVLKSFPNPFTDRLFLNFQLPQASEVTIQLFDATGHLVQNFAMNKYLDAGNQQVEITTSNLTAGMYHAQVIIDKKSFQTSLVKVKN